MFLKWINKKKYKNKFLKNTLPCTEFVVRFPTTHDKGNVFAVRLVLAHGKGNEQVNGANVGQT
jgi:hypothetical protein